MNHKSGDPGHTTPPPPRKKFITSAGILALPIKALIQFVTTYPFMGERGEAHGCVFQRRKMRGVATNVYLWKTLEKPDENPEIGQMQAKGPSGEG